MNPAIRCFGVLPDDFGVPVFNRLPGITGLLFDFAISNNKVCDLSTSVNPSRAKDTTVRAVHNEVSEFQFIIFSTHSTPPISALRVSKMEVSPRRYGATFETPSVANAVSFPATGG